MSAAPEVLARRYERLLRAYPKTWRLERGEEMLGTLLDAAGPGQRRPSLREAASILAQGTRERLDLRRRRSPGAVWSEGLRIGALVMLGQALADFIVAMGLLGLFLDGWPPRTDWPAPIAVTLIVGVTLGTAAMVALVLGRTFISAVLTALWILVPAGPGGISWQLVVGFMILAGLSVARGAPGRQRVSAVWLAVVPLIVALWFAHHLATGVFIEPASMLVYPVALLLAFTLGALVDPRLPIAVACMNVAVMLYAAVLVPSPLPGGDFDEPYVRLAPAVLVFAAIIVALLTIGHLRARRLARI